MAGNTRHVVNMANSIVGVSILSMPYCFKEVSVCVCVFSNRYSKWIQREWNYNNIDSNDNNSNNLLIILISSSLSFYNYSIHLFIAIKLIPLPPLCTPPGWIVAGRFNGFVQRSSDEKDLYVSGQSCYYGKTPQLWIPGWVRGAGIASFFSFKQ